MSAGEAVKVAVRVRPFNQREKDRNAQCIIDMAQATTIITNPEAPKGTEPKKFAFDYSYWSHDGFRTDDAGYMHPDSAKYADQKKVFDDLGRGVLDNAFKGYNCSLFAYGQTGSGKSYSMVGYGVNLGIVPVTCEELFKAIASNKGNGINYEVSFSMLEIYNEQVRDLLNPKSNRKGGLKIRQHPKLGFVVEELKTVAVGSYKEIDRRIEEGTQNRTVAATQMNATSSRAHTVVAIHFAQKSKNESGKEMTKSSSINLVDLAGSERAESTGATGDRLKEGSAINQSLSSLGNVISALADKSLGKKNVMVPYRDSVLTKLLQNALGGNSKTVMIAALSPADINYEETLSTLRFADRAKKIKTQAVINENPTDKLIRELREENARLLQMLKEGGMDPEALKKMAAGMAAAGGLNAEDDPNQNPGAGGGGGGKLSDEEMEKLKEEIRQQMMANESELSNMEGKWEDKVAASQKEHAERDSQEEKQKKRQESEPHFWNLNEDPQLTGAIVHFVKEGSTSVGSPKGDKVDISLSGLSIMPKHCEITSKGAKVSIKPCSAEAKVLVNGEPIVADTELMHNDRVMFGSNHLYIFCHPAQRKAIEAKGEKPKEVSWENAQREIAVNQGFQFSEEDQKKEDQLLQEDLITLMPMVNEANAMSEELNKKVYFEIVLMSPAARGLTEGRTEIMVKMKNLVNDNSWMWDRQTFLNRKFLMQEMYQNFVEGDKDWDLPPEKDPFWEAVESEVLIGSVHVFLQSLSFMIDLSETLPITDYRGKEQGNLKVDIIPCDASGKEYTEDDDVFVEDPSELVGKPMHFKVKIDYGRGLDKKYTTGMRCKFKFYLNPDQYCTDSIKGTTNPDFKFSKQITVDPVTDQLLNYLNSSALVVEVYGQQSSQASSSNASSMTTKELIQSKNLKQNNTVGQPVGNVGKSGSASSTRSERRTSVANVHGSTKGGMDINEMTVNLALYVKRFHRQQRQLDGIQLLIRKAQKKKEATIKVKDVEEAINNPKGRLKEITQAIMAQQQLHKYVQQKNNGEAQGPDSKACNIQ
eukprot:Nk52_evm17s539 gene=Nk52_evmTU17s539